MRRWCARPGPPTPRASGPGDLYADRRPNHWLGAVSLNKTPSASPLARLSPSHGASRIRKRAGSPSHQELLFPPPPTDLGCQRDRAGASIGSDPTLPSRTARKLILLRAYSASGGLTPRSPAHRKSQPLDLLSLFLSAPSYEKPEPTLAIGLQKNAPPFRAPALQRIHGFESILSTCRNRCSSPVVLLTPVCSSEPESFRPRSPCAALWRPAAHK